MTTRGLSPVVGLLRNGLLQCALGIVGLFWLVPVLWLLLVSLRPESANRSSGWWTALTTPTELTLSNYRDLLADAGIRESFVNTLLIAFPATLLVVVIAAPAAYALAWMDFPGRDYLMLAVVSLLVMPLQMALIPVAKLYGWVGLFGTIPGVVLYHVGFGLPFAIYILSSFFAGLPRDLLEAARMDGAHEWRVFQRVVLPINLPAIASLTVFEFLSVWNDFLVALVFTDPDSAPITVALRQDLRQFGTSINVLSAGSILSMAVPLMVFFMFQRYFVARGVLAGSTK